MHCVLLRVILSCVYTCEHFVRKHDVGVISTGFANRLLSVFSTNTKVVYSSVGTIFVWIFVLFHIRGKIFLSRQQFSRNWRRSWFVIFPWFTGRSWKNKFSEHVKRYCRIKIYITPHIFRPCLPLERWLMWKDIAFWSKYCVLMQHGVFINLKYRSKCNLVYLRLVIMKKT